MRRNSEKQKTGRLFFALVMPSEIRTAVQSFQETVSIEGRCVKPELFHATLAFIGIQPQHTVARLIAAAETLQFTACEIVLDRPGQFRRSQVGWLGAHRIPRELSDFRTRLVGALSDHDIEFDQKPWAFHVTLYRKMRKPLPIMPPIAINWPLNRFSLLESVPSKEGVKYQEISHWPKSG